MVYSFRRGDAKLSCETRLNPDGEGYQLVITHDAETWIEPFTDLPKLLGLEHELVQAWRAQGWRDVPEPVRRPTDTWSGPQ